MSTGKIGFLVIGVILLVIGIGLCASSVIILEDVMATPTPLRMIPGDV